MEGVTWLATTEHDPSTSADVDSGDARHEPGPPDRRALDSIAAQTVRPSSVLVVDDASTDDTVRVAPEHGASVLELAVNGGSGPLATGGSRRPPPSGSPFSTAMTPGCPTTSRQCWPRPVTGSWSALQDAAAAVGSSANAWAATSRSPRVRVLVRGDSSAPAGCWCGAGRSWRPGCSGRCVELKISTCGIRVLELGDGVALGRPGFTYYLHEQQAIHDSDLMRDCYGQIVDYCLTRPWFDARTPTGPGRDGMDGLRAAATARDRSAAKVANVRWMATRPNHLAAVVNKLRERRRSRAAES